MTKEEAENRVLELINQAKELTPKTLENDLPPIEGFPDVPSWLYYEHEIWKLGEEARQILIEHKSLRKNEIVTKNIIDLCMNKNAKRGREPFLMLLWYKHNQKYADKVITLINDNYLCGHVIEGFNKIQVPGYHKEVIPYLNDKRTWIKKQAKKYLEKIRYSKRAIVH